MNVVAVTGRLVRDPAARTTGGGTEVADMRIAIARNGNAKNPAYIAVDAYGPQAVAGVEHLKKGSRVAITGRIDFEEWTAKEGGGRRSKNLIVAQSVDFLDPRYEEAGDPRD